MKKALSELSLKIETNSIFGLLGPNGAGKSTLINMIAGLTNKSSGSISICGCDQDQYPEKSRSFVGVVPQELNLDPFLTPKEALDIQAGLFGVSKGNRKTLEILEKVGLADVKNAYARSLSGGMRRRLLIAKALVHSPSILILDEPTAGVDIELREMLWEYIFELRSMGTTIILTTHYLEEAQKVCDQIGILNKGTLVEYGETSVLLRQIKNKVLIIQPSKKISKIPKFPSSVSATIRTDGTLQLSFDRSVISTEEVINFCRTDNFSIKDLVTSEPALEDVFRLATKN
tara:strand:- start:147 stop:1010 length:864 start_codon:yes stop_codon:yes gene_type:complete